MFVSEMFELLMLYIPLTALIFAVLLSVNSIAKRCGKVDKMRTKRILTVSVFAAYLCIVIYLTLIDRFIMDNGNGETNLVPFIGFAESFNSTYGLYGIISNVVLFIPLGFFLPIVLPNNKYVFLIIPFVLSLAIEIIQIYVGKTFDINELILNFIGSLIGLLVIFTVKKLQSKHI